MKISKKSWHYRVQRWAKSDSEVPKDLCSYIAETFSCSLLFGLWSILFFIIGLFPGMILGLVLFKFFPEFFVSIQNFMSLDLGFENSLTRKLKTTESQEMFIIIVGSFIFATLSILTYYSIRGYSILKAKAIKNGYCPTVELKD